MIPAGLTKRLVAALPTLGEQGGFTCHHCTTPIADETPYVPLGRGQRAHVDCDHGTAPRETGASLAAID